jgi:hypothetical protein
VPPAAAVLHLMTIPSSPHDFVIRVEELTAELENLKRLSAQKQLQDKVTIFLLRLL